MFVWPEKNVSEPEDGLEAILLRRWSSHLPWQLSGLWSRVRNATAEHRSDATELQLAHSFWETGSGNRALNISQYLQIICCQFLSICWEKSLRRSLYPTCAALLQHSLQNQQWSTIINSAVALTPVPNCLTPVLHWLEFASLGKSYIMLHHLTYDQLCAFMWRAHSRG